MRLCCTNLSTFLLGALLVPDFGLLTHLLFSFIRFILYHMVWQPLGPRHQVIGAPRSYGKVQNSGPKGLHRMALIGPKLFVGIYVSLRTSVWRSLDYTKSNLVGIDPKAVDDPLLFHILLAIHFA